MLGKLGLAAIKVEVGKDMCEGVHNAHHLWGNSYLSSTSNHTGGFVLLHGYKKEVSRVI